MCAILSVCVCLFVCMIKSKQLKLNSPNLAQNSPSRVFAHKLTLGPKVKGHGNFSEYLKYAVRSVAIPADFVPFSGQHFQPTTCCRAYRPSSASVLSHTPVRLRGTHCPKTSVPHQTLQFSDNVSKLIISA